MTETEIMASYRQARDQRRQIEILSQLNACKPDEIVEILLRGGVTPGDLPKKYRPKGCLGGEEPPERGRRKGAKPPAQRRDPKTGKIICAQCGIPLTGAGNRIFCQVCIEKRRKEQTRERVQRDRAKREAEYIANPKKCADCGTVLENRLATYCKPCAAVRERESMRRSNRRRYMQREK